MHFSTLLFPVAALLSLTTAIPTPVEMEPRACTTIIPSVLTYWNKEYPDSTFPGGMIRMKRTGGTGSNTIRTGFTFAVPQDSTGCMLQWELPAISASNVNEYATGANTFNLFGVDAPVTYSTTWNNQPGATTQWSSMNVPEAENPAFKTILASNTCNTTMSYMVELADWQQNAGEINVFNDGFRGPWVGRGFKMIYNC